MRPTMLVLLALVPCGLHAQQVLLGEGFRDNAAGWKLETSGFGKPVAEIADGRLLLRTTSGGGETSLASATLTLPVPHANLDVSFTIRCTDGQFWSHSATFDLLDAQDQVLGTVGFASQLSAQPGISIEPTSRRYFSLIRTHGDLAGEKTFAFNFHQLKQGMELAAMSEREVRKLRVTFADNWMGRIEVTALRVVAGEAPKPLPAVLPTAPTGPVAQIATSAGSLTLLADRPAWVSLRNRHANDEILKNRTEPAVPIVVSVDGQRLLADSFRWTPVAADKPARRWTGGCADPALRLTVTARPDDRLRDAWQWEVEARNDGPAEVEVVLWPLALDSIVQVGAQAAQQRVVMPTWIGFNGPIAAYTAGCSGTRSYPQNLSMQYMALYNPVSNSGLAVWTRDPTGSLKFLDVLTNDRYEAGMTVRCGSVRLQPGASFSAPPVVVELSGGDWAETARHYGDWWRNNLVPRTSPAWVKEAGQIFHQCTGYGDQAPPLATQLPATYQRFQQPTRKFATPMTFDLGEIPQAERGGAAGEAAGLQAMRARFGARSLIYMPAITEYDFLPVSSEKKEWYILRPDGTMLPAWEKNATFCPGYQPVIDYRVRQALTRITTRGADGLYVDESLAQSYHDCYNVLHGHPKPHDWGQSQRRLWQALRQAVDAERSGVGLITEGCCDIVVDCADAFMAWPSGPSDGVPPMRAAFPERAYFSNGPAAPAGTSPKAAYGLQFVNGVAPWFVNQPPPAELAEWTAFLADWRQRATRFLVSGKVLRDPVVAPNPAESAVIARAYGSGDEVLIAAVNIGTKPWAGTLVPPSLKVASAREVTSGKALAVQQGKISLSLEPAAVALVRLR